MQSAGGKIEFLSKTLKNFSETQKIPIISREDNKKADKTETMEVEEENQTNQINSYPYASQDQVISQRKSSNIGQNNNNNQKPSVKLYGLVNHIHK
jgi:hypothetical protein